VDFDDDFADVCVARMDAGAVDFAGVTATVIAAEGVEVHSG
jgi:hypothetical protein